MLVSRKRLYEVAFSLNLGEYLFLSTKEELDDGRTKRNTLANVVEAIIGAVFYDNGENNRFLVVRDIILKLLGSYIDDIENLCDDDYKSQLDIYVKQNKNRRLFLSCTKGFRSSS